MARRLNSFLKLLLAAMIAVPGCALRPADVTLPFEPDLTYYQNVMTEIEYPDVDSETYLDSISTPAPITIGSNAPQEYWELTFEEAMQIALTNSRVLRDLGGLVLQSPDNARTIHDPAITHSNPRFGVDAALSAFDASFAASAFFENNDRALNNVFFGGGTRILKQDLHAYNAEISKQSATGGRFSVREIIDYDLNNAPGNDDPNRPWLVRVEGEFRQPLLQGAGVDFNRVAGPGGAPGAMNGVLIARIDTDISLADFEMAVRNLINDVEVAYWELYYAYRDLDAKLQARDRALTTWRSIYTLNQTGRRGGEAEKEAQAREQYYRLEEQVQNALTGRLVDRVRTIAFRGLTGVHASERRLRLLMGVATNDGRLIRPAEDPLMAKISFQWDEILVEALTRRSELRRQKWRVKRAELELVASRNFLLPEVDAVGRYRWRGLGHDLINSDRQDMQFDNAFQDLTTGDFQEWQLGVEVAMPIGFRKAHAAVRHAELLVARQRAILEQQEKEVVHDLSAAIAELERAYASAQTNYNRRMAAEQQLAALENKYQDADESDKTRLLDLLLDAQRRVADAETNYYRALLEYTLAVKNVHFQKGSLLDYNEIYLAEGPWPGKAYFDAQRRSHTTVNSPGLLGRMLSVPWPISRGPAVQRTEVGEAAATAQASRNELPEYAVPVPDPPPADDVPVVDPSSSASISTRGRRFEGVAKSESSAESDAVPGVVVDIHPAAFETP